MSMLEKGKLYGLDTGIVAILFIVFLACAFSAYVTLIVPHSELNVSRPSCPSICDDNNPCTTGSCSYLTGYNCSYSPVQDGTLCGDGKICWNGNCLEKNVAYIQADTAWKKEAVTMRMYTESLNWDADAKEDGIQIHINILNDKMKGLNYDEPATFDIEIISLDALSGTNEIATIYHERHAIDSLRDISSYAGAEAGRGVRIEFRDMNMSRVQYMDLVLSAYLKVKVTALVSETQKLEAEKTEMIFKDEIDV